MTNQKFLYDDLKKSIFFKNKLFLLKKSISWQETEIKSYQLKELKKLIKFVIRNNFYYSNKFKEKGIDINEIKTLSDIKKLPFLTKNDIKNYDKKLISNFNDRNKKALIYMTTGGTTGNPLKIWMDFEYKAYSLATTYFYMHMAGLKIGKYNSVRLHGDTIAQRKTNKKIYWEYSSDNSKKLIMSSYHLNEDNIFLYTKMINKHKPKYIHAYPSVISLLASYIKKFDLNISCKILAIFTDCEVLYEKQQKLIENIFKCQVYNTYGHTEGAVFGMSLKKSKKIYLSPIVGIVELIDKKGNLIKKNGIKGEVVVTGFLNKIFPIIRYKTQDIASYANIDKKIKFKAFERIEGRKQDYIISKNNNLVPIGPALFDYNFDWSDIDRFQILQKKPGEIIFLIIISRTSNKPVNFIKKNLKVSFEKILNYNFNICVRRVNAINFTKIGKFKYLKQELKIPILPF